jgi:hypothetical protein
MNEKILNTCNFGNKQRFFDRGARMDIGVWMSAKVLSHKLAARAETNPEQTWSLNRWPKGMSEEQSNRLFVASGGYWRGYFKLSDEALFNPRDAKVPYTLLFDTRTWTPITPSPAKRFRGFTYKVPSVEDYTDAGQASPASRPTDNCS